MESIKNLIVARFGKLFNLHNDTSQGEPLKAEDLGDDGIPVKELGYHDRDEYEEDTYSDPDDEQEEEDDEDEDEDEEDNEDDEEDDEEVDEEEDEDEDEDDEDDEDEVYEEGSQSEEWYNYYEDRR